MHWRSIWRSGWRADHPRGSAQLICVSLRTPPPRWGRKWRSMPIHRAIALLLTGATSMLLSSSNVHAQPVQQTTACPVASDAVVSTALGTPAKLMDPEVGVTVNGSNTECMFMAGGEMVLVRRTGEFFSTSQATPESVEQLRLMVSDDLDYAPVSGVGDAALWATVRDRSLAPQRMEIG